LTLVEIEARMMVKGARAAGFEWGLWLLREDTQRTPREAE
jgi:hypothetical protein